LKQQIVVGVGIGAALVFCLLLLIYLIRRNPAKAKKILVSFLSVEVLISVQIVYASIDFYTDLRVLTQVLERPDEAFRGIVVPWLIFFALACLVSTIAIFMKIQSLVRAIRLRRVEINLQGSNCNTSPSAKLLKHRKNAERTRRAIRGIYGGMLVGLGENLPLGILTMVYTLRDGKTDVWALISLTTSFASLGMGLGKVLLLKDYQPYLSKQRRKIRELEGLVGSGGAELGPIDQDYAVS
jgi:hypothetical protein